MKKKMIKNFYLWYGAITVLLVFAIHGNLYSQGEIISVNPSAAFPGETTHLIIQGENTNFIQGVTKLLFHECNIKVNSVLVNNPELVTASITVGQDVEEGECTFELFTSEISYYGTLEVIKMQDRPEATITVFPVQSVYLTDYDLSNLRNLPLLFNVTLFTAGRDFLKIKAVLKHETYGLLASAEKDIDVTGPVTSFNNKEFDNYDLTEASDELIESISPGGTLPPGGYQCAIMVYDKEGNELSQTETTFYIPESQTTTELVSPGTELNTEPDIVVSPNPYFQWYGNAKTYDFYLFEVHEGQQSEDDIATNRPVYQQTGISQAGLVYPNFARALEQGKTYAWQIRTGFSSTTGNRENASRMLWFVYNPDTQTAEKVEVSYFEMEPGDVTLAPGDTIRIAITGFDTRGNKVPLNCKMSVIPSAGGEIKEGNLFVAGKKPGIYAILAEYGDKENYITLNIRSR